MRITYTSVQSCFEELLIQFGQIRNSLTDVVMGTGITPGLSENADLKKASIASGMSVSMIL